MADTPDDSPRRPVQEDWTRHGWEDALAAADRLSSSCAEHALQQLRTLFPPELTPVLRSSSHPVLRDHRSNVGRLALLELALAAGSIPITTKDKHRLRDANEYEATAAEIRAAHIFVRAGATVTRPPTGFQLPSCEYVAEFPSGSRFAIEVKLPQSSKHETRAEAVEPALFFALISELRWLAERCQSTRATFRFSPEIDTLPQNGELDRDALAIWVEQAGDNVVQHVSTAGCAGTIALGPIGTLELRAQPDLKQLEFDAYSFQQPSKKLGRRLTRNVLNKAARQVAAASVPGLVVLDSKRDPLALNSAAFLSRWAKTKPMLAAIILLDRHVMASDGRMYGNVTLLPGPLFANAVPVFDRAFEFCSDEHLHYNVLSSPSVPCPCTWLSSASTEA